jgi:hypothetical protein
MLDNFYLELLDDTVYLYSFDISYKKSILGALLPILLDDKFFSMTQSEKEFSLFVSTKLTDVISELNSFNDTIIRINHVVDKYSVLRIYQDTHNINEHGIVFRLSKIFYEKNIPILYVNSYSNNYVLIPTTAIKELDEWIEY